MKRRRLLLLLLLFALLVSIGGAIAWKLVQNADREAAQRNDFQQKQRAILRVAEQSGVNWPRLDAVFKAGKGSPVSVFTLAVTLMKRHDFTACPDDFKQAFQKLIEANQQSLRVATTFEKVVPSFEEWNTLAALPADKNSKEAEHAVQTAEAARIEASQERDRIALRYGVDYERAVLTEPK